MIEFLELVVAGASIGLTSAFLLKVVHNTSNNDEDNTRPLSGPLQRRLDALKELTDKEFEVGVSTEKIRVKVTCEYGGYYYSFHYYDRANPFITFLFNEKTKSIENFNVQALNPNHKEVKATLTKLKNKVLERHLGTIPGVVETFSKASEVKDKCNELILRIKYLQLQTETEPSHLTDICDNIEPMLRDVMEKFDALNEADKETFTSKTLDIFYSIEKKIKSYEWFAEQRKKQILEQYFADMEKQADTLAEGK